MTWDGTRSFCNVAISTSTCGTSRTSTSSRQVSMEQSLTFVRRARSDQLSATISAFESETQAVIQATSPFSERAIVYLLAGMTVIALLLMSVVKLDRVVAGGGRIIPTQGSLFVQPLDRAIVTGIAAHTGDVVRKGQ